MRPADKFHLTGKPTEVMRWLVRQGTTGRSHPRPVRGLRDRLVLRLSWKAEFHRHRADPHNAQIAAQRLAAAERGKLLMRDGSK